ncbi:Brp/Blh family beta-carotene 15,15'-dioxygenase [Parerythrobacter aurantius]|uniref:Brp/Blh family beta-carotene 15,15'-dioxygenase n=1 Tax=Parerythrobacter aurantius TaxID=3127706 RepID=UPI00324A6206
MAMAACFVATIAQLAGEHWAIAMGIVLFALGFSHGAGEEDSGAIRSYRFQAIIAYLLVGSGVAALYLAFPLSGLVVFFLLSAWHFARCEPALGKWSGLAIAGLAIGGSALFRPAETEQVLSLVVSGSVPAFFMTLLTWAGGLGSVAAVAALLTRSRGAMLVIVALIATAMLQPVLAVGLVFLVCHAIPVLQRQLEDYGADAVWAATAWPTVTATLGAAALVLLVLTAGIDLRLAVALALGLATPHMLTERLDR